MTSRTASLARDAQRISSPTPATSCARLSRPSAASSKRCKGRRERRSRARTLPGDHGRQAERMTRLIDDLLLLSRVEEKANLKPTGRVDLNDVIEDVVRSLTPFADERHMTITSSRQRRRCWRWAIATSFFRSSTTSSKMPSNTGATAALSASHRQESSRPREGAFVDQLRSRRR